MAKGSLGTPTKTEDFLPQNNGTTPLQQALESLNVNLEDELMRYRQSRSKDGVAQSFSGQLKFRSQKRRRGLNLIQVQTQRAKAPASGPSLPQAKEVEAMPAQQTQASPLAPPPPPGSTPSLMPVGPGPMASAQAGAISQQNRPVSPTMNSQAATTRALQRRGMAITPYRQGPDDYLESTEALLDSLPSPYDDRSYDDVDYQPSLREQLATPLGIGALLLLLVGSAGFGYIITSPKTAEFLRENTLVQALIGNDADVPEVEVQPQVEEPDLEAPETGLQGIGPDLSEDEFQDLNLGRLSTLEQEAASSPGFNRSGSSAPEMEAGTRATGSRDAESTPSRAVDAEDQITPETAVAAPEAATGQRTASGAAPTPTTVTRTQVPANPQPATAPSPQVGSVPTRPTVTPVPQVMQAPQPVRQAPPQPVRATSPSTAAAPPQPLSTNPTPQPVSQTQMAPPVPLAPPATPQSNAASTTAPAPISQPPPQNTSSYYVITDYTGDQSLQNARSAVGGAYVRNFPNGARIQMGAFSQESAARSLVQQLQGQGIPAQVYAP